MRQDRSGERGMALVIVMFMVLTVSILGAWLVFVSNTETLSSVNYQTATQTRYSAESGISAAANYLLNDYTKRGADPVSDYDTTKSPVELIASPGKAVVLSSNPAIASNYPVLKAKNDFLANAKGQLAVGSGSAGYSATATLLSMRQITDTFTGLQATLQTWRIVGTGSVTGVGGAAVEVSAILETESKSVFNYGLFATGDGCDAIKLNGNVTTDSYDSRVAGSSNSPDKSGGDLGTNGNFNPNGNAVDVWGSLSTPRAGVGKCGVGGITGATSDLPIHEGITQLAQPVTFPTPPDPSPLPPDTDFKVGSGCGGTPYCTASAGGITIHPTDASTVVTLGNLSAGSKDVIHVSAGIYVVNSIDMGSQSQFVIDGPGPVIIKVAGKGGASSNPISLGAQTLVNPTYDPSKLQILYGGSGTIKMSGGAAVAAMMVAPNAAAEFAGGANTDGALYGAMIVKTIEVKGNFDLHYDRALSRKGVGETPGNPVLQQFTWSNY